MTKVRKRFSILSSILLGLLLVCSLACLCWLVLGPEDSPENDPVMASRGRVTTKKQEPLGMLSERLPAPSSRTTVGASKETERAVPANDQENSGQADREEDYGTIKGRVVDSQGSPVAGAIVAISDRDELNMEIFGEYEQRQQSGLSSSESPEAYGITKTDDSGHFCFLPAWPGDDFTVMVKPPAPLFPFVKPIPELRAGQVLTLPDLVCRLPGRLRGQVLDSQGRGIAHAYVLCYRRDRQLELKLAEIDALCHTARLTSQSVESLRAIVDPYQQGHRLAKTGPAGHFLFNELWPSDYAIHAFHPQFRISAKRTLRVRGEQDTDLTLTLQRNAKVRIAVVDEEDAAIAGVDILVFGDGKEAIGVGKSDEHGFFALNAVREDWLRVFVKTADSKDRNYDFLLTKSLAQQTLRVIVKKGFRVTGRVRPQSSAIPFQKGRVALLSRSELDQGYEYTKWTVIPKSGQFLISGVVSGTYLIYIEVPGFAPIRQSFELRQADVDLGLLECAEPVSLKVQLQGFQKVELELSVYPRVPVYRGRDSKGEAVMERVPIETLLGDSQTVVQGVLPGAVRMAIHDEKLRLLAFKSLTIGAEAKTQTVTIKAPKTGQIHGWARDHLGAASLEQVYAIHKETGSIFVALTNAKGRFQFSDMPPGDYWLLFKNDYEHAVSDIEKRCQTVTLEAAQRLQHDISILN